EFNHIKSLPVADTNGLFQKIQAAIFLLLDELWLAPSDINDTLEEREKSLELLQKLYDSVKEDSQDRDINMQQQTSIYDCSDDNNFFKALESKLGGGSSVVEDKDEVICYMRLQQLDVDQNPLK
ncbi:17794_t:CDS:2, partial [Cetraspora pellucida]